MGRKSFLSLDHIKISLLLFLWSIILNFLSERNRDSLQVIKAFLKNTLTNIDLETMVVRYWKIIQELRQIY